VKSFAKILLILIFSISWLALPYQAYAKLNNCSVCCKQITCSCNFHGRGFSEQSLHNRAGNPKTGHGNYKPCSDCTPQQNREETLLVTVSVSDFKKKPGLFVCQTILPENTFVLNTNRAISTGEHPLLSSLSLFLLNESLRL
jgi:hypothetical protein